MYEALLRGGIAGKLRREKLERNGAAERRVLGFVDDTHPALAELLEDPVMRYCFPYHSNTRSFMPRIGMANRLSLHLKMFPLVLHALHEFLEAFLATDVIEEGIAFEERIVNETSID